MGLADAILSKTGAALRATEVRSISRERLRLVSLSSYVFFLMSLLGSWSVFSTALSNVAEVVAFSRLAMALGFLFCLILCLVGLVFSSYLLRSTLVIETIFNITNFVFYFGCVALYFGGGGTTVDGCQNVAMLVLPIVAVLFSRSEAVVAFWVVIVSITALVTFIFELLHPDRVLNGLNHYTENPLTSQLTFFSIVIIPILLTFVIFLYTGCVRNYEQNIILHAAVAICRLDFQQWSIVKLIEKKSEECSKLELSLRTILMNMSQYSKFLPEHLKEETSIRFVDSSSSSLRLEYDSVALNAPSSHSIHGMASGPLGSHLSRERSLSHALSRHNSDSASSSSSDSEGGFGGYLASESSLLSRVDRLREKNPAAFSGGLLEIDASVLVCDVDGFLPQMLGTESGVMRFNRIVGALRRMAGRYRGTIESIDGRGRIVVLFNGRRFRCVNHQRSALLCAKKLAQWCDESEEGCGEYRVTIAICAGRMWHGTLGSDTVKRTLVLGIPFSLAVGFREFVCCCEKGEDRSSKCQVYADENVQKHTKFEFISYPISAVWIPRRLEDERDANCPVSLGTEGSRRLHRLYWIGSRFSHQVDQGEWLFQVAHFLGEGGSGESGSDDMTEGEGLADHEGEETTLSESLKRCFLIQSRLEDMWSLVESGEGREVALLVSMIESLIPTEYWAEIDTLIPDEETRKTRIELERIRDRLLFAFGNFEGEGALVKELRLE